MAKTKIEWCDATINPVKGLCPVGCSYCYARRMYKRFKWNPGLDFNPFWANELPKKPSKIFMCSTMELFHDSIPDKWREQIFGQIRVPYVQNQGHTFIFLTKQPQNLIKWTFPDNCWIGVSLTGKELFLYSDMQKLEYIQAKVKFISFEPLLKSANHINRLEHWIRTIGINWLIIGCETKNGRPVKEHLPKIEWIREIVEAADKANIPVFLKNNLEPLLITYKDGQKYAPLWANGGYGKLRQEFPK